jgi:hypothetical protein
MGWRSINKREKEEFISSSNANTNKLSNVRFGELLLLQLLVKGKGSPFKKEEKNSSVELDLNKNQSELNLK